MPSPNPTPTPSPLRQDHARRRSPQDATADREGNRIERGFCALTDWRRIATRCDKPARKFLSAVAITAEIMWWT